MCSKIIYELDHARHDAALIAPGLIQLLGKGDRDKKLDISYQHGNEIIEFRGPDLLGVREFRVLSGIVGLSGIQKQIILPNTTSNTGIELRKKMGLSDTDSDVMMVELNLSQLSREVGYKSNRDTVSVRESIERLAAVTIFVGKGSRRKKYSLISEYESDAKTGQCLVAINPRATLAVLGESQYYRISLRDMRKIKNDYALLLLFRLSWINQGKSGKVSMEKLLEYVWGEEEEPNDPSDMLKHRNLMKKRRQRIRNGFDVLKSLGWEFNEYVKDKFKITRPTAKDTSTS